MCITPHGHLKADHAVCTHTCACLVPTCRDILNLSRLAAGPTEPTGSITGSQQHEHEQHNQQQHAPGTSDAQNAAGAAAGAPAAPAGSAAGPGVAVQEHPQQIGSRLRHSSSAAAAGGGRGGGGGGGVSGPISTSLGHWAAATTPASKAATGAPSAGGAHVSGSGMSPGVSAMSGPSLHQRLQHNPAASTPQCAPGHVLAGSAGAAAAAAAAAACATAPGGTAASAGSVSFAKSLGGGVYAPGAGGGITPLPLAATHGPGARLGSCLRGPSPLGPAGVSREPAGFSRETVGLQALMGPQAGVRDRHQQGQLEDTPVAGTGSDAAGGAGAPGSVARRSMQLLPGSFRLAGGHNNSPGV